MRVNLSFSDTDLKFTGIVNVTASASPPASRVDYYIDNIIKASRNFEPFAWAWDTSLYSDGNHVVKAVATHKNGRTSQQVVSVSTLNTEPPPPSDTTPPTVPGSFAESSDEETSITVSWVASTDAVGVAGYNLYKNGVFVNSVAGDITSYTYTGLTCGTTYSLAIEAFDAAGNKSAKATINAATENCPAPPSETEVYVSDLTWTYSTNGWGPVEKDKSNGEKLSGDGTTITIGGVTFSKGLGVHAFSDVRYALNKGYTRFRSTIGVDDEVGNNGSVIFEVWTDGVKKYTSPIMYGNSANQTIDLDVTNVNELRLVCNDAGNGVTFDHGSWGGARLVVSEVAPPPPPPLPSGDKLRWSPPVLGSNGVPVVEFILNNSSRGSSTLGNGQGRDLLIRNTEVLTGPVAQLVGWRHIIWIGGEFNSTASSVSGHILPRECTGTVHLEGIKYRTSVANDCIAPRYRVPILQIQNCDIQVHTVGGYHSDCFQTQHCTIQELRCDKGTFTTDYQGFFISNEPQLSDQPVASQVGKFILSRWNFRPYNGAYPATFVFKAIPSRTSTALGPWEFTDVWMPDSSPQMRVYPNSTWRDWTGADYKHGNFLINSKVHPNSNSYKFVRFSETTDTVPTGAFSGQQAGDCTINGEGGIWLHSAAGNPPNGDFRASNVGLSYVSPGYL